MTEEGNSKQTGPTTPGPPPSGSGPVLLLVIGTAASLLSMTALLFRAGDAALKSGLVALTLAPIVYGWWLLARSRRRGPLAPTSLTVPIWGVLAMPTLSRVLLDLAEGRQVGTLDVTVAALLVCTLPLGLLAARQRR